EAENAVPAQPAQLEGQFSGKNLACSDTIRFKTKDGDDRLSIAQNDAQRRESRLSCACNLFQKEGFFFGGCAAPLETTSALPPMRTLVPDLADGRVADVAHRLHMKAGKHVAIGLKLNPRESFADGLVLMRDMRLHRHAQGIGGLKIIDHGFQLLIAVVDVKTLPLEREQLSNRAYRLGNILRPVAAVLEPARIFRGI